MIKTTKFLPTGLIYPERLFFTFQRGKNSVNDKPNQEKPKNLIITLRNVRQIGIRGETYTGELQINGVTYTIISSYPHGTQCMNPTPPYYVPICRYWHGTNITSMKNAQKNWKNALRKISNQRWHKILPTMQCNTIPKYTPIYEEPNQKK